MRRALLAMVALAAVIAFYKLSLNIVAGGAEYAWVVDPLNYDSRESANVGPAGLTLTTSAPGAYYNPQLVCINFLLHREVTNVTFIVTVSSNQTGILRLFGTLGGAGTDKYASPVTTLTLGATYSPHYLIFYNNKGNILDYFNIKLKRDSSNKACDSTLTGSVFSVQFYVYRVDPVTMSETQVACHYFYSTSSNEQFIDKWVIFNLPSSRSITLSIGPEPNTASLTASMVQSNDMYKIAPIQYRICLGVEWTPDMVPASLTMSVNVQYSFK